MQEASVQGHRELTSVGINDPFSCSNMLKSF